MFHQYIFYKHFYECLFSTFIPYDTNIIEECIKCYEWKVKCFHLFQ